MNQTESVNYSASDTSNHGGHILQTVVDAMLDSLTVEQQTKMASYLLRNAREQNGASIRSAATTVRV